MSQLVTSSQRRNLAVALATHAVNGVLGRNVGDPVHEEVTEGRRLQYERALRAGHAWARNMPAGYHSCGDLAAWLLWRLGCRDESLVNRTNDGGTRAWIPGRNLTVIAGSRAFVTAAPGREPQPGDVIFLNLNGGHVAVVLEWDAAARRCVSADYGQPYGRRRSRVIAQRGASTTLDGSTLRGWLDLDRVTFAGALNLDGLPGGNP